MPLSTGLITKTKEEALLELSKADVAAAADSGFPGLTTVLACGERTVCQCDVPAGGGAPTTAAAAGAGEVDMVAKFDEIVDEEEEEEEKGEAAAEEMAEKKEEDAEKKEDEEEGESEDKETAEAEAVPAQAAGEGEEEKKEEDASDATPTVANTTDPFDDDSNKPEVRDFCDREGLNEGDPIAEIMMEARRKAHEKTMDINRKLECAMAASGSRKEGIETELKGGQSTGEAEEAAS